MQPGKGPVLPQPIETPEDLSRLIFKPNVDQELSYVYKAITVTRHRLEGRVPLIGFCGAPWTLFAYMTEGGGSKTFQKAKTFLYQHPEESRRILQLLTDVAIDYLVGQARAGAQMLQVFDSHAGELSPQDFITFGIPFLAQIGHKVKEKLGPADAVPMTIFAKGAHYSIRQLGDLKAYDSISLDWTMDPTLCNIPDTAVQGNMDPTYLYAPRDVLEEEVKRVCSTFNEAKREQKIKGWVANLGHGITPAVDPESLRWFLQCTQKYSSKTS